MSIDRVVSRSRALMAIRANDIKEIQAILSTDRAKLRSTGRDFYMLRASILYDRRAITDLLLDHGCRVSLPSFRGFSPLHIAVAKPLCSYELVQRLLTLGANVDQTNKRNETPIQLAFSSSAGDKVVKLLLHAHLQNSETNVTNDAGLSYLHIACATGDLESVKSFVERGGADVNAKLKENCDSPDSGSTPLHMAVNIGDTEIVQYLLERGASVYAPDGEGSTAIHLAFEIGEADIIELLFEYDSERRNVCNDNGLSHFMAACACSSSKIAQEFLANNLKDGSSLNINVAVHASKDEDYSLKGCTALHCAAIYGAFETTKLLLANGADCCAANDGDVTPMQFAEWNNYQDVADLIEAHCQG